MIGERRSIYLFGGSNTPRFTIVGVGVNNLPPASRKFLNSLRSTPIIILNVDIQRYEGRYDR